MKLTQDQAQERWRQLRALVCHLDPAGLIFEIECQRDEYDDCLVEPLMRLLESQASEKELVSFLENEMIHHFGINDLSLMPEFARQVRSWYQTAWPNSTTQDGVAV
jgi:hypothetical protein